MTHTGLTLSQFIRELQKYEEKYGDQVFQFDWGADCDTVEKEDVRLEENEYVGLIMCLHKG